MAYGLPQKIDVSVWLHLAKDFRDTAFGVDDKSGSLGAHIFLAEEILFHPHAVTLHQCLIRIGKERERQPEFIDKFLVTSRRIHADTKNLSTAFHFFPGIAEVAQAATAVVVPEPFQGSTTDFADSRYALNTPSANAVVYPA